MKEFDDIFNKKLNEEQPFAGQKSSWTVLNRNLHALEIGAGTAGKALAVWKAVGIVAVMSLVGILVERRQIVTENKHLRETVGLLQSVAISPEETLGKSRDDIAPTTAVLPAVELEEKLPATIPQKSVTPRVLKASSEKSTITPSILAETTDPSLSYPMALAPATSPIAAGHLMPTQGAALEPEISAFDSISADLRSSDLKQDSVDHKPVLKKDMAEASVPPPGENPVIDPVRPQHAYRWRAGVHFVVGIPQPKARGISPIIGQGIGVSYRLWKGLALTAAADFLKFDVNADSIPRHFPAINLPIPDPGHHATELRNVTSNQVLRQYRLGAEYALKLAGPWQASLRAAHTWVCIPSRLTSLRFEEAPHGGGGPQHPEKEYFTLNTPKTLASNIWRFGVGLQYELSRWSIGVAGDYSMAAKAKKPSLDAAFASAELLYKF